MQVALLAGRTRSAEEAGAELVAVSMPRVQSDRQSDQTSSLIWYEMEQR